MLSVVVMTVMVVMVIICTYECDCIAANNANDVRPMEFVSVSAAGEQAGFSSSADSLPFVEYDTSIFDHMEIVDSSVGNADSAGIQNYFLSFLPTCPSAYKLTLTQNSTRTGRGMMEKRKKNVNLRSGQYTLCKDQGKARFRPYKECPGTMKSCAAPKTEYWISNVESLHRTVAPVSPQLNGLVDKDDLKDLAANCQPRKCSSKQLMAINMKNHIDCGSFYICIMGQHFLLHCPSGSQFSEEYGVCIEKQYANCQINPMCKY